MKVQTIKHHKKQHNVKHKSIHCSTTLNNPLRVRSTHINELVEYEFRGPPQGVRLVDGELHQAPHPGGVPGEEQIHHIDPIDPYTPEVLLLALRAPDPTAHDHRLLHQLRVHLSHPIAHVPAVADGVHRTPLHTQSPQPSRHALRLKSFRPVRAVRVGFSEEE